MKKNVGEKDKWIRIVLALALFPLFFLSSRPYKWIGLVSIPLILTAVTQRYGVYAATGISTFEQE